MDSVTAVWPKYQKFNGKDVLSSLNGIRNEAVDVLKDEHRNSDKVDETHGKEQSESKETGEY